MVCGTVIHIAWMTVIRNPMKVGFGGQGYILYDFQCRVTPAGAGTGNTSI